MAAYGRRARPAPEPADAQRHFQLVRERLMALAEIEVAHAKRRRFQRLAGPAR